MFKKQNGPEIQGVRTADAGAKNSDLAEISLSLQKLVYLAEQRIRSSGADVHYPPTLNNNKGGK